MEIYLKHCLVGAIVKQMCQAAVLLLFPIDIEGFLTKQLNFIHPRTVQKGTTLQGTNISRLGRRNMWSFPGASKHVKTHPLCNCPLPPQLGRDTFGRNPKHPTFMKPCKLRDIYHISTGEWTPDFWLPSTLYFFRWKNLGTPSWNRGFCAVWCLNHRRTPGVSKRARFFLGCFLRRDPLAPWDVKLEKKHDTVDGQNPAPPRMMTIPLFKRFNTFQVVQDFFHQQYLAILLVTFLGWSSDPNSKAAVGDLKNQEVKTSLCIESPGSYLGYNFKICFHRCSIDNMSINIW